MIQNERLRKLEAEGQQLSLSYPNLSLKLNPNGTGSVTGQIEVADGISYSALLHIPTSYPDREPVLYCDAKEIPWKLRRHVYENSNGVACLCGRCETRVHWPKGSDLTNFVTKLVHPYFVCQFYYDAYGKWPPTGERSHGKLGILETFVDLLTEIRNPSENQIKGFLRLLARKNNPKGHEKCPCGSGKNLRLCHEKLIAHLRSCIDPRHALLDLKEAFGFAK